MREARLGDMWFNLELSTMSIKGQNGAYIAFDGGSLTIVGEKGYLATAGCISDVLDEMLTYIKLMCMQRNIKYGKNRQSNV